MPDKSFAKQQKQFFRACKKSLPCAEARKEFEHYAAGAVQDYLANCPGCTFAQAAEQLGGRPVYAVQAFLESQSAETRTRWQKQAQKVRRCTAAVITFVILLLVGIIVFYYKTNGVMIVNTKTTIIDYGDLDMSDSEFLQWAESLASSN